MKLIPASRRENVDAHYSSAQLGSLDPVKLLTDDLVIAYKTALSLDAPQTTNNFATELLRREGGADKLDVNTVYRRLINERLSSKKFDQIETLLAEARAYDERHYQGREAAQFDLLDARVALMQGRKEQAIDAIRHIPEKHPARLDIAASAI